MWICESFKLWIQIEERRCGSAKVSNFQEAEIWKSRYKLKKAEIQDQIYKFEESASNQIIVEDYPTLGDDLFKEFQNSGGILHQLRNLMSSMAPIEGTGISKVKGRRGWIM